MRSPRSQHPLFLPPVLSKHTPGIKEKMFGDSFIMICHGTRHPPGFVEIWRRFKVAWRQDLCRVHFYAAACNLHPSSSRNLMSSATQCNLHHLHHLHYVNHLPWLRILGCNYYPQIDSNMMLLRSMSQSSAGRSMEHVRARSKRLKSPKYLSLSPLPASVWVYVLRLISLVIIPCPFLSFLS